MGISTVINPMSFYGVTFPCWSLWCTTTYSDKDLQTIQDELHLEDCGERFLTNFADSLSTCTESYPRKCHKNTLHSKLYLITLSHVQTIWHSFHFIISFPIIRNSVVKWRRMPLIRHAVCMWHEKCIQDIISKNWWTQITMDTRAYSVIEMNLWVWSTGGMMITAKTNQRVWSTGGMTMTGKECILWQKPVTLSLRPPQVSRSLASGG